MNTAQFILCTDEKVPVHPLTREPINPHDSAQWMPRDVAEQMAASAGLRLAYVFTADDPYFLLDIDHCLEGANWSPLAQELLNLFPGAYVEVSRSGDGLHIIGSYTGPEPDHRCKVTTLGIELYTSGRFVLLTGDRAIGSPETDCSAGLSAVIAQHFPPIAVDGQVDGWTTEPVERWNGPTNDDELVSKALASVSTAAAFGNRATFRDLWEADADRLAAAFPAQSDGQTWDGSSADAALAAHLAFWTGRNCERMQRLMWASKLVRDKWNREDYLPRTIVVAAQRQENVYTAGAPKPDETQSGGYMTGAAQAEYFAGCVYVQDEHAVFVPSGALLKPDQFRATYGGHTFAMDNENRRTSRSAWEAFTESQVQRPTIADSHTFEPLLAPGAVVEREGQRLVNTYVPADVRRVRGDVGPFLDYLQRLLPVERDRQIILAYMAACVQRAGVKFQWAPLLQGTPGNGKSLLSRCVMRAVGARYSHFVKPSQVAKQFNAWIVGRLFIGMEDVYLPDRKGEVIEELKPLITNDYLPVEPKGKDQQTKFVCANFMLNMNRKDGLRKTRDDRRFAVFFTPQQTAEDLARYGMTQPYFAKLYDWLRADGYAIVADYLHTVDIPAEFDPAGECVRAPDTSTSGQAIKAGAGSIEQEIMEAIEQELPGFAGGWISSIRLDKLLEERRLAGRVNRNQRAEILESLGYVRHPALPDGRVNNPVQPDNGKPRLYVHTRSAHYGLQSAAEVAAAYTAAQSAAVQGSGGVAMPPARAH